MASINGGGKSKLVIASVGAALASANVVRVGFLENATYPDGKPVAMIAAIHNYGKWPFFTNMVRTKKGEWGPAVAALLKSNKFDAAKTLGQTGEAIAGQLRQAIIDTVAPPNAPSTVARKGFDKPLVESGHLLGSVDYEVKA